eukprot:scaffold821_cov314-Prasinococcus_capsulatus_cf.AAC.3
MGQRSRQVLRWLYTSAAAWLALVAVAFSGLPGYAPHSRLCVARCASSRLLSGSLSRAQRGDARQARRSRPSGGRDRVLGCLRCGHRGLQGQGGAHAGGRAEVELQPQPVVLWPRHQARVRASAGSRSRRDRLRSSVSTRRAAMEALALTSSGRPVLLEGEVFPCTRLDPEAQARLTPLECRPPGAASSQVELVTADEVEIKIVPQEVEASAGPHQPVPAASVSTRPSSVIVTTHRVLSLCRHEAHGRSQFFHVAAIADMHASRATIFGKRAKLRGQLYVDSMGRSAAGGPAEVRHAQLASAACEYDAFGKSSVFESFVAAVQEARSQAAWARAPPLRSPDPAVAASAAGAGPLASPAARQHPPKAFEASSAGLGGHLRRAQEQMSRNDAMLSTAFTNLEVRPTAPSPRTPPPSAPSDPADAGAHGASRGDGPPVRDPQAQAGRA